MMLPVLKIQVDSLPEVFKQLVIIQVKLAI